MNDLKLYGKTLPEIELLLDMVYMYSHDIAMEFGLDGAILTIKGEKE